VASYKDIRLFIYLPTFLGQLMHYLTKAGELWLPRSQRDSRTLGHALYRPRRTVQSLRYYRDPLTDLGDIFRHIADELRKLDNWISGACHLNSKRRPKDGWKSCLLERISST
jgi:hypothetical protein